MAKRTFSHRGWAKKLSGDIKQLRERAKEVGDILKEYLSGTGSPGDVINNIGGLEVLIRYNDHNTIKFNRNEFLIVPPDEEIKQKLNYLIYNMPPVPKSFENMYLIFINLEDKDSKKKLVHGYFNQLPENVYYYIPVSDSTSIKLWKDINHVVHYRYTRRKEMHRYFDKGNVIKILKYAGAINENSQ